MAASILVANIILMFMLPTISRYGRSRHECRQNHMMNWWSYYAMHYNRRRLDHVYVNHAVCSSMVGCVALYSVIGLEPGMLHAVLAVQCAALTAFVLSRAAYAYAKSRHTCGMPRGI